MGFIIAIDGPAGAGKSTIAKRVAIKLGVTKVDTGAIYRSVTLAALEKKIEADEEAIARLIPTLTLRAESGRFWLDDREISEAIRTPEVTKHTSPVSAFPKVREGLLDLQRQMANADPRGAVLEGRDIGTVVFPSAALKIFLDASVTERARRRVKDLEEAGQSSDFDEVKKAIEVRDTRDSSRAVAPLKRAEDAVVVDSTNQDIDQVVSVVVELAKERGI